jgi:hypothetical protein
VTELTESAGLGKQNPSYWLLGEGHSRLQGVARTQAVGSSLPAHPTAEDWTCLA